MFSSICTYVYLCILFVYTQRFVQVLILNVDLNPGSFVYTCTDILPVYFNLSHLVQGSTRIAKSLHINTMPSDSQHGPWCIPECKYSGKEHRDSGMIRCSMCMNWYHSECVKETHPDTIHTCGKCTNIASDLRNVLTVVSSIMDKTDKIVNEIAALRSNHEKLAKEFSSVKQENEKTKCDNTVLRNEVLQ